MIREGREPDNNSEGAGDSVASFNHRVYDIVRQVPSGRVTTYGAVAEALGDPRKAREVGWALNANPTDDPCPAHRVVNREGRLSGGWAFGSPDIQRGLLEAEGVTFLPDGRVDLERHLWRPDGDVEPPEEGERQEPLF